jgi:hypothetical protein
VVSKERIAVGGQEREAYRVVTDTPMGQVITWETGDGMPIRAVAPMGITLYAESEAIARDLTSAEPAFSERGHGTVAASRAAYVPPSDFAVGTSVEADRRIVDAANLRVLVIELQGLRKEQAITDSRQRVTPIPGKPGTYRVEVEAGTLSAEQAAALPLRPPRSVAAMTGPATYLETDDSRIRELAEQIRSRETNAYRVACRIRAWVHRNMRPDYTIGTPRSCVDILKNKRGVCRDYATLFVSIARAAGIPARIAGGIVYTRGRFYYHAWGECWVGQWVAFDATRATDFVDATHIKLAEGGVPEMYQVVNAVGRLKARIIQSGSGGTAVRSGDLGLRGRRPVGTVPTSFARAGVRSRHITTRPARTVREVVLP